MTTSRRRLWEKRCPKCGGANVYLDSDHHGWYEHCLQCGFTRDMEKLTSEPVKSTSNA